ncbi:hypothetical protein [Paenibacillus sp. YN15]|uniref:hypothetical protein n=1 Tax=Paenibacillus sp. YN15 TaxID=1742774 RepID=UPI000DCDC7E9|nr:hypothetical protein [Paenibacillus sp. YN15]RAV04614.1 hypothetical protein DQG13_05195 [Paenibacillus sp. YN15]
MGRHAGKAAKAGKAVLAAVLGAAVLLTGALVFAAGKEQRPGSIQVARVNGDSVSAAELKYFAGLRRASVIDEFSRKYGVEFGEGFWIRQVQGQTPLELLRKQALTDVVRLKVVLQLARREGVIQDTSFAAVEEEMGKENERRKKAVANGEPIYGPVRFEASTFVPFYQSKLAVVLKEKLAATVLAATEEQLKAHYEAYKRNLFPVEDRIRFEKAAVSYRLNGKDSAETKQAAQAAAAELRRRLAEGQSVADAAVGLSSAVREEAVAYVKELVLDSATASRMFKSEPLLYEALRSAGPDQSVLPVQDDRAAGCYVVAKVNGREAVDYISYEESRDLVKKHYLDIAFEAYIDEQTRIAAVDLLDGYDKVSVMDGK